MCGQPGGRDGLWIVAARSPLSAATARPISQRHIGNSHRDLSPSRTGIATSIHTQDALCVGVAGVEQIFRRLRHPNLRQPADHRKAHRPMWHQIAQCLGDRLAISSALIGKSSPILPDAARHAVLSGLALAR
jgi:hypothetical protein